MIQPNSKTSRRRLNSLILREVKIETLRLAGLMEKLNCLHLLEPYGHSFWCTKCQYYAGDAWGLSTKD